jgi:hypothetical protein
MTLLFSCYYLCNSIEKNSDEMIYLFIFSNRKKSKLIDKKQRRSSDGRHDILYGQCFFIFRGTDVVGRLAKKRID